MCLQLYYHMHGKTMGTVNVYIQNDRLTHTFQSIFYIYFTIASRENNYFQCRYGLIDILYKSYLRNYKKLLFMQLTKS